MLIYARGRAVVEHGETAERFEIYPDELDWEAVHGSERSMGLETVYVAAIDHNALGEIRWTVSEYPVGAESFKETDTGKHKIVEDFDYGLEHEPENAFEPGELREQIQSNPNWILELTQAGIIQHLVNWFHHFYTDPANETPYESSEGGYIYIYGGPYSAEDEIRENFEGLVPEDAILRAVAEIERDGIFDWAPSSNHPDQRSFVEEHETDGSFYDEYSFEQLIDAAASASSNYVGSTPELEARSEAIKAIAEVRQSLPPPKKHGGIGHNNPPEPLDLDQQQVESVSEGLEKIEKELSLEGPDIEKIAANASFLAKTAKWAAKKLDLTFDEFCKSFGSSLGKAAGYGVPVVLAAPFWGNLVQLLGSLKNWILVALGM